MKKVFALAAFAALLLVGASKLNARVEQEEYHYGFITTCGPIVYMDMAEELTDDECVDLCLFFDDYYCG